MDKKLNRNQKKGFNRKCCCFFYFSKDIKPKNKQLKLVIFYIILYNKKNSILT